MKNRVIWAVAALVLGATASRAQPNPFCTGLAPLLESGVLYAAKCATGQNCLNRVVKRDGRAFLQADGSTELESLVRWRHYHFLYKVAPGGVPNSLVVIQLKWSDTPTKSRDTIVDVNLRRKSFGFACYRTSKNIPWPAWPPEEVPRDRVPAIPYAEYDQFHRFGYTSGDANSFLRDEFHVRYFNGEACVSTLEPVRRAQFLMHDRENLPGRISALLARLGWNIETANAQELDRMRSYEKLKALVTSYQKRTNEGGCFAFSARSGSQNTTALDITMNDMEAQARFPLFEMSQTWSFEVK